MSFLLAGFTQGFGDGLQEMAKKAAATRKAEVEQQTRRADYRARKEIDYEFKHGRPYPGLGEAAGARSGPGPVGSNTGRIRTRASTIPSTNARTSTSSATPEPTGFGDLTDDQLWSMSKNSELPASQRNLAARLLYDRTSGAGAATTPVVPAADVPVTPAISIPNEPGARTNDPMALIDTGETSSGIALPGRGAAEAIPRTDTAGIIRQAEAAIAQGADPTAVQRRLEEMGINHRVQ